MTDIKTRSALDNLKAAGWRPDWRPDLREEDRKEMEEFLRKLFGKRPSDTVGPAEDE